MIARRATGPDRHAELGFTEFDYYGCKVLAPRHDWPHVGDGRNGWLATAAWPS